MKRMSIEIFEDAICINTGMYDYDQYFESYEDVDSFIKELEEARDKVFKPRDKNE